MNKQYKIIIFICALAILCNFAAKYSLINEQNKNITTLQKMIAAARSNNNLKSDIPVLQLSSNQNEINKIMHSIPEEFSFTQYAANLRSLVDADGLYMKKNLVFMPETIKDSELLRYNANITLTGDYKEIKKLIADILNLQGVVNFNSISFARNKDSQNQNKIDFKFGLSIFFKREAE